LHKILSAAPEKKGNAIKHLEGSGTAEKFNRSFIATQRMQAMLAETSQHY
jgi:hypothetical protein